MLRLFAVMAAACCLLGLLAVPVRAQSEWNDAPTMALVQRATALREQQLADTALHDWRATAHGYLTFLAQLGEGFTEPPKVVKADELELEVYWRAPGLSKQRIVGRRDTLLLPTDIAYHRDHLGIVQNNFPEVIRVGEGDEVRDVPHPLSPRGLAEYEFAIGDSIEMRLPDRAIRVAIVRVRPVDDTQPRVIGALFIERGSAQLVRMAFNFTRAAFVDRQLEDLAIVLENALVGNRFWLPRRQEVEIRRSGTWMDFPVRGIIRGRWEICCHEVNVGLDAAMFAGPEIVQAPQRVMRSHAWGGAILDSLPPDVRAPSDPEVRTIQEEARRLVRGQALARARRATLAARGASDVIRVRRAEGLAVGGGVSRALGGGVRAAVYARYGFDDEQLKPRAEISWMRANGRGVRVFGEREYRDAGDIVERSGLINSIAAQEFGSDATQPYDVRAAGVELELGRTLGASWRLAFSYEEHDAVHVVASPSRGTYEPVIPALHADARRVALSFERPTTLSVGGTELRLAGEVHGVVWDVPGGSDAARTARAFVDLTIERPVSSHRLVSRTTFAVVDGSHSLVPSQELVYLGGPVSGPGYRYHELVAEVGGTQRLEWRMPAPFLAIPLGRFGQSPPQMTFAPYAHTVFLARPAGDRRAGWYPSLGAGVLLLFDALRLDVARGLRDGKWTFSADLTTELWRVL
ncbi:MAG: hypothetical protein ACT4PJ_00725 [Gemmatimonadaceae bacterium]